MSVEASQTWQWEPSTSHFILASFLWDQGETMMGALTTLRWKAPLWRPIAHWKRLVATCQALGMQSPWATAKDWAQFLEAFSTIVPPNGQILRVCVAQSASGEVAAWLTTRPYIPWPGALNLTTILLERSQSHPKHKTTQDLIWGPYLQAVQHQGFDEGLRLTSKGFVAEGLVTNVFGLTQEGTLITPCLDRTDALPGLMQDAVIQQAQRLGIPVAFVTEPSSYFQGLVGVFLTNAVRGLLPVAKLDNVAFDLGQAQALLEILKPSVYDSSSFS